MRRLSAHALWLSAIALAGLVFVAGAVAPGLVCGGVNANESAAIATLKNIWWVQSQCQATVCIDVNGNDSGEYGFFGDLSGAMRMRGTSHRLAPPVLSSAFSELAASRVEREGYLFQMFLPSATGVGVAEDPRGGDERNDNGVDPHLAETFWCCYAWPCRHGLTGMRAYFINQGGDLLASIGHAATYDGGDRPCMFTAAFRADAPRSLMSPIAANTVGHDGNTWVMIG